jgi:Yip1-like protein
MKERSMTALLKRVRNILLRPGAEWLVVKDEPATYRGVIAGYVAPLAAVPPVAAVLGRFVFDRNIPDRALSLSLNYLLFTNLLWFGMIIISVMITGAVITAVMAATGSRWGGVRGLQVAAYSFTPLFLAGLLAGIPFMAWSLAPAIVYSVYILYQGIRALSTIQGIKAAWFAGVSFLAAAVIVGVMNMFEYMLESFVATRMFL